MLAKNDEKNLKYYLESIARGALPIFSVVPAVREAKILRESMKRNWKFQSWWEGSNQKPILGEVMEIFWHQTLKITKLVRREENLHKSTVIFNQKVR